MSQSFKQVSYVTVDSDRAGQRVDNFLIRLFGRSVPKSYSYRVIRQGQLRVNKKRVKPEYRLNEGDEVRVPPVTQAVAQAKTTPTESHVDFLTSRILLDHPDFVVINKPAGMPVHGGTAVSLGVMDIIKRVFPKARFLELAHRLDKGTSGCLLIAKKRAALLDFQAQFKAHTVDKHYLALTRGRWLTNRLTVKAPLIKNQLSSGERIVKVSDAGKPSKTLFKVQEPFKMATLVEAILYTGRTHQIRVHAAYKQHPIAGDDKYGDREFNQKMKQMGLKRLFLHAYQLGFSLNDERFLVEAPLDENLSTCLERMASL